MSWWPNLPHPDRTWIRPYHSSFPWMLKAQNIGNSLAWCSLGCYDYCKRRQPDLQSENNNRHQVCFTWLICCSNVLGQKKVQKQVCLVSSSNTKTSKEAADVSLHTLFFSLSKPCTAKTAIPSFHSH